MASRTHSLFEFFFYQGTRVGKNGKQFKLFKFRTMHHDADANGPFSVSEEDARVTSIGRVIRKTHLDELPNLINVISGDMRLFGPRPEVPHFINKMPPTIRKVVLSVKPGCIDLATMRNLDEGNKLKDSDNPDLVYEKEIWPEKLRLQCQSILKISL